LAGKEITADWKTMAGMENDRLKINSRKGDNSRLKMTAGREVTAD